MFATPLVNVLISSNIYIKTYIKIILTKTPVIDIIDSEQGEPSPQTTDREREGIAMRIGYARVSTLDQNLDRQIDNLREKGCEKIFMEKITGTKSSRPEYNAMLNLLETRAQQRQEDEKQTGQPIPGDVLVIDSFSRLSRSTKDLLEVTERLNALGVQLVSIKEELDTRTATGRMMMTMLAALSQFERDILVERTKDGLKAARARGRVGGRSKAGTPQAKAAALAAYDANTLTNREIANQFGVSVATLNRWIAERKRQQLEAGEH